MRYAVCANSRSHQTEAQKSGGTVPDQQAHRLGIQTVLSTVELLSVCVSLVCSVQLGCKWSPTRIRMDC